MTTSVTDGAAAPPQRSQLATRDEDEARKILDDVYGARLGVNASPTTNWLLSLHTVDAGTFSVGDVVLPADLRFDVAEHGDVVIGTATGGLVEFERGKHIERYLPGDAYIGAHPHGHSISRPMQARTHTITLPQALLTDVARGDTAAPGQPWRFTHLGRLSADNSGQWRRVTQFVDELLTEPATATSPLLLGPAGRLLAATALTIFPNTLLTPTAPRDRTDARPRTVRRAVAYIDAYPDLDISLADIARAAFVTPRAIQLAFRRYLDTTPMAYLRTVRLERAHADLQTADPTEVTVTGIASRWGFSNPGRFAAYYAAAYGHHPGTVLGRSGPFTGPNIASDTRSDTRSDTGWG